MPRSGLLSHMATLAPLMAAINAAAEGITYGLVEEEIGAAARAIGITTETGPLSGPPFVIVTSNTYKQIGTELKPVRSYPWGDCVVRPGLAQVL